MYSMRKKLSIFIVFVLAFMCHLPSAQAQVTDRTPAVRLLEANEDLKGSRYMKIEGLMMRMARPTLKKTPAVAIMDNMDCLYMFSFKENSAAQEKAFVAAAEKMLKSYTKASEIKDDISHSVIYLDDLDGNVYHEIIMLVTWPSVNMMIFHGNFTEASLRKMEAISKKQRAEGKGALSAM